MKLIDKVKDTEENLCPSCMKTNKNKRKCQHCGIKIENILEDKRHLRIGTFIRDRYYIGKALGCGSFGVTYTAYDSKLKTRIVIKEYFPIKLAKRKKNNCVLIPLNDKKAEDEYLNGKMAFLEEARLLARFCKNEGIVSILDYFEENNTAYIVMEYVDGQSLNDYLKNFKKERLPYKHAKYIIIKVLCILEKIHKYGILHREISPENIYIDSNGNIKLLDFGAAKHIAMRTKDSIVADLNSGYAPLEMYNNDSSTGPWSDIYSVGAVFYKIITGKTIDSALARNKNNLIAKPSELGIIIPKNDENVLMKTLEVNIQDRYKSINEIVDKLGQVKNFTVKIRKKKLRVILTAAAASILVILLLGVAFAGFIGKFDKWNDKIIIMLGDMEKDGFIDICQSDFNSVRKNKIYDGKSEGYIVQNAKIRSDKSKIAVVYVDKEGRYNIGMLENGMLENYFKADQNYRISDIGWENNNILYFNIVDMSNAAYEEQTFMLYLDNKESDLCSEFMSVSNFNAYSPNNKYMAYITSEYSEQKNLYDIAVKEIERLIETRITKESKDYRIIGWLDERTVLAAGIKEPNINYYALNIDGRIKKVCRLVQDDFIIIDVK